MTAQVAHAAAAGGLDPSVALDQAASDDVKRALRDATERAGDLGVRGVPSVLVGGTVFFGDDHLEAAAAALHAGPRS
jgi:2-hydroxychromene-2-carboxylate isomerase